MLNVAAGLTRLGHESELATWFARDARGDKVREHAEAAGVTLTPGSDGAEFTTVAHAASTRRATPHLPSFDLLVGCAGHR